MVGSIFQNPWWCEASSPGSWDAVEHAEDGVVVGRLVYCVRGRLGLRRVTMPYLSRAIDPFVSTVQTKKLTSTLRRRRVLARLIATLPRHDSFYYVLPPSSENTLPFALMGFDCRIRYTFTRDPDDDEDVWASMDQKTRNVIRSARSKVRVDIHADVDRFERLCRDTFMVGVDVDPRFYPAVARIWAACHAREQSLVLSAVDQDGRDVASSIVIWDGSHLYYWMSARNRAVTGVGANSLLIWAAMGLAKDRGLIFDVDGFATESGAQFLVKFGLAPKERVELTRQSAWAELAYAASRAIRQVRHAAD